MTPNPPFHPPTGAQMQKCKHPRVQIVSRDEDEEYVECLECGEVFESSEFKDMSIEESSQASEG
jgi:transcription initiation factor TFIIIB Brf1 subunit/transcription initiation factor TFIIB